MRRAHHVGQAKQRALLGRLLDKHVERLAGDAGQDLAEEDHAQVAVAVLRARLVGQVHAFDALDVGVPALDFLVQRRPVHEPG